MSNPDTKLMIPDTQVTNTDTIVANPDTELTNPDSRQTNPGTRLTNPDTRPLFTVRPCEGEACHDAEACKSKPEIKHVELRGSASASMSLSSP